MPTLNNKEVLLIDVPEQWIPFVDDIHIRGRHLYCGPLSIRVRTPEGDWTLLGLGSQVKEEDARELAQENICDDVKMCPSYNGKECCGKGEWFSYGANGEPDYEGEPVYTAAASLHSYIRSQGKEPERVVVLVKN